MRMDAAVELGIRAPIIPYTPPGAVEQWAVRTYGREGAEPLLHLGSNDVHNVYVSNQQAKLEFYLFLLSLCDCNI